MQENKNISKKIYGIDSLYFFFESNENYDDLYLEILDQLEEIKGKFEKREVQFENKDAIININDIQLTFLGKQEGFYFFRDSNELFRIGFKDRYKNRGLNDIKVQLEGNGIYTIGIKGILNLLKNFLADYINTDYIPITRVDINCFIQHDLSFISKEMFSTRKRKYSTINEIGTANTTQTIYVGKEPFKLRVYNKTLELQKSKKFDVMNEYFSNNGFDMNELIFNVEFQIHRTHLRKFNIECLDDLLVNIKNLWFTSLDEIRLIDVSSVSQQRLENNKYQAQTHELWEELKNDFNIKEFLQTDMPLERLKRKISVYSEEKFEYEFIAILRKAYINNITLDPSYIDELYLKAKDSFTKKEEPQKMKKNYIDVEVINEKTGETDSYRLLNNGELIKPLSTYSVCNLSDYDLLVYLDKTSEKMHLSKKDRHIYYVAFREADKRNLILKITPDEALEDF